MSKQELFRTFNYVQADLQFAGRMARRTSKGARLAHLRRYVGLFSEYVNVKRELRKVAGFHATQRADRVETLPKAFVFGEIKRLEEAAWAAK